MCKTAFPFTLKWYLTFLLTTSNVLFGRQNNNHKERDNRKTYENKQESVFYTTTPKHDFDIVSARPTDHSVTLSVLMFRSAEAFIVLKGNDSTLADKIKFSLIGEEPKEIVLDNLQPDRRYFYHLYYKTQGEPNYKESERYYFQTQRIKNESFTFTITADSHLDQNADTLTYKTTLLNALADSADFHIDLGDTYMTDKYRGNYKDAMTQYLAQRYYFGLLCPSSPLFSVLGNHDGESGQRLNGTENNMTVWSNLTRKKYFPNPYPNGFYTGNTTQEPFAGSPQDYYAWEWGNALFVVLDPFWYTPRAGTDDPWERTLSKKQYDWLKATLENSEAKFKFVFIHNLVGGADIKGRARGGVEVAGLYEWGGHNSDGSQGFESHRPGWEIPIHNLLVKNKVTMVFHGHDHVFAKQESDGIIYQCVPQPGAKEFGNVRQAEEYGYVNGVIMNGTGYMRIRISKYSVKAEYVSTNLLSLSENKKVVYSYEIKP